MATHSSILAWRIPWRRRAWQATVHGVTRVRHNWSHLACKVVCIYVHECVCMCIYTCICIYRASLVVQTIKNLPAMQETQVRFLGQEDPLGKGIATHSSILAWEISWTEEPSELQSVALQRVRHDWMTSNFNLYINWVHYHTLTLIPPLTTCYFCHIKTVLVLTTHLDLKSGHQ